MKSLSRACASITPLLSGARSQTARTLHFVSACPLLYSSGRHRSTSVCCRGERLFAIHSKVFSRASTLAERPPRSPPLIDLSASEHLELHERHVVYLETRAAEPASRATISLIRLLDGCPCPRCLDPSTRQRLTTFSDSGLASQTQPVIHSIASIEGDGVQIVWDNGSTAGNVDEAELHRASYTPSLIRRLAGLTSGPKSLMDEAIPARSWRDADELEQSPHLRFAYASLQDPAAGSKSLYLLLRQLKRYGIVIIEGLPSAGEDSHRCELETAMKKIGPLHNTFYGATWDVKSMKNSKNVAYTNQNLGLHQDLLYMASPPNFQALHCLRNRVAGGMSYFVDGFAVQDSLSESDPELGERLREHRVPYEYDNDCHWLQSTHAVFSHHSQLGRRMHWSPPFRGVATPSQLEGVSNEGRKAEAAHSGRDEAYYLDLIKLESVVEEPARRFAFTMNEGDLVLFNNTRILHARTAFRNLTEEEITDRGVQIRPGEPTRWLKGCYLDEEAVYDKLAVLGRSLGFPE